MENNIKKYVFLLLFLLSFCFADNAVFDSFDSKFFSSSQAQKEKLYGDIKHIYIESIVKNDEDTKYEALQRLVVGAKELGYKHEMYEKELKTSVKYDANAIVLKQNDLKKTEKKTADIIDKQNESVITPVEIVKVEQFDINAAAQNKTDKNESENNRATKSNNTTLRANNTNALSQNTDTAILRTNKTQTNIKLISAELRNGSVVFGFDNKIENVKQVVLKEKSVRHIFDLKAIYGISKLDLKIDGVKDVRVSQFDQDTVRIVFETSKDANITYAINGNELRFDAKEFVEANMHNSTISTANKTAKKVEIPKKIVVIDAGHGGKDSGAIGEKKFEKSAVLQTAVLLGNELKKRGYTVHYTRSKDVYLKLQERTKIANDKNADIFISIHANAAPKKSSAKNWQGIETFFLSPTDSKRSKHVAELENQSDVEEMDFYSKQTFLNFLNREKIVASHKLAIDIQQQILTSLRKKYSNIIDGGVREAPFWVLTGAQMPAVLLEIGYITHKTDRERMFDKKFQNNLVSGIADGIDSYFVKNS